MKIYVQALLFFVDSGNKLSSHMDHISEHINYSNHKIHSYDQMSKAIVNLDSKKWENNNNPTHKLNNIKSLLLMIIVDTPESMYQMLIGNQTR